MMAAAALEVAAGHGFHFDPARLPGNGAHRSRRDPLAACVQEPAQQKLRDPGIAFHHAEQTVSGDRIFGGLLFREREDADATRRRPR